MTKKSTYDNESISSLKGADRVRKRPAVIFGSDGMEGCEHSFFEILSNSIDEAREGQGDRIEVIRYADGSMLVEDFGRGIPLDYNAKEERFNWELVYCELYAGGKYRNITPEDQSTGGLVKSLRLAWKFAFDKPKHTVPEGDIPVQPITRAQLLAAQDGTLTLTDSDGSTQSGTYTLTQHDANDVLYDLTLDSETGTALVGVTEYTDAAGEKSSEYTLILSLPERTVYFRADMAQ